MNTFINVNNWLSHTWLMRESPFLRHISATTWATNTRQRKGNSTRASTWKSSWNRVRSVLLFIRRCGCVSKLWQYIFFSNLICNMEELKLDDSKSLWFRFQCIIYRYKITKWELVMWVSKYFSSHSSTKRCLE